MADQQRHKPRLTAIIWLVAGVALGVCVDRLFRQEPTAVAITDPSVTEAASAALFVTDIPTDIAAALDEARQVPPLTRLRQLVHVWTHTNLPACLNLLAQLSATECREVLELFSKVPDDERRVLQRTLARHWAKLDAESLFQAIPLIRGKDARAVLAEEAARELVSRDPAGALTRLSKFSSAQRQWLGAPILLAVTAQDPARAGAFLVAHPEFSPGRDLLDAVGRSWAQSNPQDALAWAKSLPAGRTRTDTLQAVWMAWAEKSPTVVAAEISRAPETRFHPDVFKVVVKSWSLNDPGAALAWIESLPRKEDQVAAWNSFQPDVRQLGADATLALVNAIQSEQRRAEVAARVASQLAQDDPPAALAWAERLPEGAVRDRALRPVLGEWSKAEPAQAVNYLTSLPAGAARTELLREAVRQWTSQNMDAAMAWIQQLPADAEREGIALEAMRAMREEFDPREAIQWLEFMQSPESRQRSIEDIAGHWARTDGAAAASWLNQLSDVNDRVSGHYAVARQWAFEDSDATAQWLTSLPSGASRDAAIRAFVMSVDGYDAGLATAWAAAIEEPREQQEYVRHAFNRWLENDSAGAQAWLERARLSAELRTSLLRAAETRKRP